MNPTSGPRLEARRRLEHHRDETQRRLALLTAKTRRGLEDRLAERPAVLAARRFALWLLGGVKVFLALSCCYG